MSTAFLRDAIKETTGSAEKRQGSGKEQRR